jgi:Fe(3+) dicitrate transport protein
VKYLLLLLTVFFGMLTLSAQIISIQGKIIDLNSHETIPGINIMIKGTQTGTSSSGNGTFRFMDLEEGEYVLEFSGIGYIKLNRSVVVEKSKKTELTIEMVEDINELPAVVIESVTLTGGLSKMDKITGSGVYVSPAEIEKFNYADINRILKSVPGVNLQEEDGYGLRPNIGLRGSGSERSSKITLMEDGILIAPAPYTAPAAYYFPNFGRMHAVEILKGSSQIKYGPNTTGGALNLISTPIPTKEKGLISLEGGSFKSNRLHAYFGNTYKNMAFLAEAFTFGSGGFKKLDNDGPTGFFRKDFNLKFKVFTNPTVKLHQSLQITAGYNDEISNETYLGLSDEDFNSTPFRRYAGSQKDVMKANHSQFSARYAIQFSNNFELAVTGYYNQFNRNWYKTDKVIADTLHGATSIVDIMDDIEKYATEYEILRGTDTKTGQGILVKANNRSYYSRGVQANAIYSFNTNALKHKILFGLRLHKDLMDRYQFRDNYAMDNGLMKIFQTGTPGSESNRIQWTNALAGYVDYTLTYNRLIIKPGFRYEYMDMNKWDYGKNDPDRNGSDLKTFNNRIGIFIPGIGIHYKMNEWAGLFTGIHKGFSPPGTTEGTLPEESVNYEVGIRINRNAFFGELIGYYNDYSNLLGADLASSGGTGSNDLYNAGKAHAKGLEMQAGFDVLYFSQSAFSLPFKIVYTYTRGEFDEDFDSEFSPWGEVKKGDEIPYVAPHQIALLLSLKHTKFEVNMNSNFMTAMRTVPGQGDMIPKYSTDAVFILDANVKYLMDDKFSLFLNLDNVFNNVYIAARRPAGARPGMPRNLMAGVKAVF